MVCAVAGRVRTYNGRDYRYLPDRDFLALGWFQIVKKMAGVSDDWIENWQASIAVKITAAVLYAIVTVGVAITVISLHNVKKNLQENYSANADRIAYQLGSLVAYNPGLSPGEIENKVRQLMADFDLQAIDITIGNKTISLGRRVTDSYVLDRAVNTSPSHSQDRIIHLKICYPPLGKTVTHLRHKWFAITGLITLFSGFLLVWVIRIFITRPFTTLINATKAVSAGNIDARIAVDRKDEFGYLSMFFNQMMDKIRSELTERKRAEEQITHMAYYDHLTQLPNRLLFKDRLHQAISHAKRSEEKTAVLFIDLDNFKRINDTLGHRIGDLLLTEVAGRLAASTRKTDTITRNVAGPFGITVARLGGDEFTILLSEIKDPVSDIRKFVHRTRRMLAKPFLLEGHEIFMTVSIGIFVYPYDGEDIESLLKNADIAMYHAKERGKNNFQLYGQHMNSAS